MVEVCGWVLVDCIDIALVGCWTVGLGLGWAVGDNVFNVLWY
jgi:hypothetical protein